MSFTNCRWAEHGLGRVRQSGGAKTKNRVGEASNSARMSPGELEAKLRLGQDRNEARRLQCEAWHDTVDWTVLERFGFGNVPEEHFIMTTCHDKEPLSEAFRSPASAPHTRPWSYGRPC